MHSEPKRILIVGAGWEQIPIIQAARSDGHYVIALDGNPHAPGFAYASEHHVVSTRDVQGVLAVAQMAPGVQGISYMITESPLYAIHHATQALGLPGPSLKSVNATVSKTLMREIFSQHGVPNAHYGHATSVEMAAATASKIGFPLVMKPADSAGQLGLHFLQNLTEVASAFRDSAAHSPAKEVILEEWLDGPEINGVGIVLGGKIVALTLSDREKHASEAFGIVQRHSYPTTCSTQTCLAARQLCERSVEVLEIQNGIIFPQIIVTPRGPIMAEFGERIPGGIMKELFEYATGYDLVAIQLDIALGLIQPLENYCTKPVFESVIVKFLNCYPGGPLRAGAIKETHNLEQVRQMEGILAADFFVNADKPQEIRPLKRAADRCFFIVAGGKNREQAIERSEFAAKVIDFTDHEGKSLKS